MEINEQADKLINEIRTPLIKMIHERMPWVYSELNAKRIKQIEDEIFNITSVLLKTSVMASVMNDLEVQSQLMDTFKLSKN